MGINRPMRGIKSKRAKKVKRNPNSLIVNHNKPKTNRRRWDAILDRLPENKPLIGAEIGVLNGSTASKLLQARPLLYHVMIDPWCVPEKDSSYANSGDDNSIKPQEEHEEAYERVVAIANRYLERTAIHRMYSHEAAEIYDDEYFDFIFIDGDHSFEGVKADIKLWLPKIKPGGFISGHDYDHPKLPGVKQAVDEAFMQQDIELDDNRTWFVKV